VAHELARFCFANCSSCNWVDEPPRFLLDFMINDVTVLRLRQQVSALFSLPGDLRGQRFLMRRLASLIYLVYFNKKKINEQDLESPRCLVRLR
jgi:hypothetical protein